MLYHRWISKCVFGVCNGLLISPPQQAAYHEEVSAEVRSRALLYGTECTNGYIDLLEHVLQVHIQSHTHMLLMVLLYGIGLNQNSICACVFFQVLQKPTGEQKQKLVMFSKKVAAAVTELIQTAEAMKGKGYFITCLH